MRWRLETDSLCNVARLIHESNRTHSRVRTSRRCLVTREYSPRAEYRTGASTRKRLFIRISLYRVLDACTRLAPVRTRSFAPCSILLRWVEIRVARPFAVSEWNLRWRARAAGWRSYLSDVLINSLPITRCQFCGSVKFLLLIFVNGNLLLFIWIHFGR